MCLWLLGKAVKVAGWLAAFAAVIAAWPLTLVIAAGYVAAWWQGRPPAWLRRAAAWSLALPLAWLAAGAVRPRPAAGGRAGPGPGLAARLAVSNDARRGAGVRSVRPGDGPGRAGPGRRAWWWRNYAITTGLAGITASAPITFDRRQWKRQVRTAKGLTGAPAAVPLARRGQKIPVGATIRAIGRRWDPVFTLPAAACARHMVIIGATGSGKTNLMMRLWAGWFTATLDACDAGKGDRPLLIVLDCKGGPDSRRKAARTRRLLYGAGARRVALWPDEARLSLWDLPGRDLAVLLYQMIDTGTGNAAYYADILQAVVILAVTAPGGPPLQQRRVPGPARCPLATNAWSDGRHPAEVARVAPRPGTCPTSSCGSPPCWTASAPPWTARAPWPTRTPGTSSWKAPANRRSPKPRPWP